MGKRSVASGTICFGLVSIPVKFYITASAVNASFNLITPDGNRVEQVMRDKVTGKEVQRSECKHGFEFAKGQYVTFNADELKALEEGDKGMMEIVEFVPLSSVDSLQIEKSYYLDADKGGDRAYRLFALALKKQDKCAVAQWSNRGRQHLVVIAPKGESLVAYQMYYADEVRDFELDAAKYEPKDAELKMACRLINAQTVDEFDVSKYTNGYLERVNQAIEDKKQGKTVEVKTPEAQSATVDLFEALKASLKKKRVA